MSTVNSLLSYESFERAAVLAPALAKRRHRAPRAGPLIPDATSLALLEVVVALGMLGLVLVLTNLGRMPDGLDSFLSIRVRLKNVLLLAVLAASWPGIFRLCGLYHADLIRKEPEEILRVCVACALGTILMAVFPMLNPTGGVRVADLPYFWFALTAITLVLRHARRVRVRAARRRILFVGSGVGALRMWHALSRDTGLEYQVAGFVDTPDAVAASAEIERHRIGTLDQLEPILMRQAIDEVCIALPIKSHYLDIQDTIRVCERLGVRTRYSADLFVSEVAWARSDQSDSLTITLHVVADDHRLVIKRLVDLVGASVALLLLSPVMLATATMITLMSPGPPIFAQERYGLNRRRFRMFKFRTMVIDADRHQSELEARNEADGPVFKIAADPRVTPLGRFLRRTSIDELPQLFNVLNGDMSLVGPRPLPVRDVSRFTRPSDMRRFSVRPGLTCLWQISGRCSLTFSEWIRLDLTYIDDWSLMLDLRILLQTIPAVLRGNGAR